MSFYGQPQGGYPGQQPPPSGYPGQQPPSGYPGQQPPPGYPGQQPPSGYPGQQHPSGYSGQHPSGYSGQQPPAGYPGAPAIDPNIASWFKAVDQDRSGQINAEELRMALQNGNWSHFSIEACKLMIGMFDRDHSGTINIQEFSSLFKYMNDWTVTYKRFDQDKSGVIDEREMTTALQQMGYRFSPQFVTFLVSKFSPRERKITLDNFIVANIQLHKLTEAFKSKDREMRGVATFSYEEFITMAFQ